MLFSLNKKYVTCSYIELKNIITLEGLNKVTSSHGINHNQGWWTLLVRSYSNGWSWNFCGAFVRFPLIFITNVCLLPGTFYNKGTTDFKKTRAYKESVQSQDLLEEHRASYPTSLNPIQLNINP